MKFWISNTLFITLAYFGFWGGIEEARYILYAWLGIMYFAGILCWLMFFAGTPEQVDTMRTELFKNAKHQKLRLFSSIIISIILAAAGHYILAILYMILCYGAVEVYDKRES